MRSMISAIAISMMFATALVLATSPAVATPLPQNPICGAIGDLCTGFGALPCCNGLRCQVDEIISVGVCVSPFGNAVDGADQICSSVSNHPSRLGVSRNGIKSILGGDCARIYVVILVVCL